MTIWPAGLLLGRVIANAKRPATQQVARTSAIASTSQHEHLKRRAHTSTSGRSNNPFEAKELRSRLGGAGIRNFSTRPREPADIEKPLIDHELEAELTDVKWVAVYRYLPIRLAAMVARMKLVQTIASVLYVPYSIFNYIQGTIDWSWLVNTTSLAVFAPLALVLFSRTMNRLVGVIAVDETNSYARIGYVSFWGRRMNKVRPIEDVVPLTNSEGDTTQKVVKLSFLSDSSYVLLPTRPVEIVDPERAHLLFGDLKFFDVENPKEQQSQ